MRNHLDVHAGLPAQTVAQLFQDIAFRQVHLEDRVQFPVAVFIQAHWHQQTDRRLGLGVFAVAEQIVSGGAESLPALALWCCNRAVRPPSVEHALDLVQRGQGSGHQRELAVQGSQHPRIGHHAHLQVAPLDGGDLLPGDTSQGRQPGLGQSAIQAALPDLLAKAPRDKGIIHVPYTLQIRLNVTYT